MPRASLTESSGRRVERADAAGGQWRVERMTPETEEAYARLVAASPSPVSHTLAWRDILAVAGFGEPIYWLAYRGDELCAALPAFVRRSEVGAVLNSLPLYQSKGGVVQHADLPPAAQSAAAALLIGAVLAWCRTAGVATASLVASPFGGGLGDAVDLPQPDFRTDRAINAIDLTRPLQYRHSVREMVAKAERHRPTLREARTLEEARTVYELYAANLRRIAVEPSAWTLYEAIYERAAAGGLASFWLAVVDGEAVAGLVLMRHGGIVEYYSVGANDRGRELQANSWMCDQQIRAAQARGDRWWNWMASPSASVHDFKKRWGGVDLNQPVVGWITGDADALRRLPRPEMAGYFPGYFVLPYDAAAPRH